MHEVTAEFERSISNEQILYVFDLGDIEPCQRKGSARLSRKCNIAFQWLVGCINKGFFSEQRAYYWPRHTIVTSNHEHFFQLSLSCQTCTGDSELDLYSVLDNHPRSQERSAECFIDHKISRLIRMRMPVLMQGYQFFLFKSLTFDGIVARLIFGCRWAEWTCPADSMMILL